MKENATHVDLQKIMSQKKQIEDINSNKSTSIAKIQDTAKANIKKINSDVDAKIAKAYIQAPEPLMSLTSNPNDSHMSRLNRT